MASVANDSGGRRRILFVAPDGRRKTVRLGKVDRRAAEAVARHVEALLSASISGQPVPRDTAAWLAELPDVLHRRLAAVGLVVGRDAAECVTLGAFLDGYIAGRTDAKPRTIDRLRRACRVMVEFFGAERELTKITPGDVEEYQRALLTRFAPNTARRLLGRAKQFFRFALRKRLIRENPFGDLKGLGVRPNRERDYFVTRDEAFKVLDACPNNQWRLLFALSRFGGLRCPSEHLALRWSDIDWERGRMTIRSPKTEHHAGKESRIVPIFPELRPYLEAAWDAAPEGAEFVITHHRGTSVNWRTHLERIIRKAGLKPWPKLFHNLRASRQTELAQSYPIHVVCEWIGNSQAVAMGHYLRVTDADYEKALATPAVEAAQKAAQKAAQYVQEMTRTEPQAVGQESKKTPVLPGFAARCDSVPNRRIPPTGLEHPQQLSEKTQVLSTGGAESGALGAEFDPDRALGLVFDAWPRLTERQRRAILRIVQDAGE